MNLLYRRNIMYSQSPYSGQATVALMAQFPTQWPTIRDYGFSHPALVPFINEDPMLVCSLMELGKIRYATVDGACWCDTGYIGNLNSEYEFKYRSTNYPQHHYGSNMDNNMAVTFYRGSASNSHTQRFGSQGVVIGVSIFNGAHTVVQNKNGMTVDGTSVLTYGSQSAFTTPNTIYVFAAHGANDDAGSPVIGDGYYFKIRENGTQVGHFVPCYHGGQYGLLDINNLEVPSFKPNLGSGSFTISETPAS